MQTQNNNMKTRILCRMAVTTWAALVLLGAVGVEAADVSGFGVLKGKEYSQSQAGTPGDDFVFYWLSAYVRMTATDSVTEATVQPPGGGTLTLWAGSDPKLLEIEVPGGLTLEPVPMEKGLVVVDANCG